MAVTNYRRYAAELIASRCGLNEYTQDSDRKYFFGYPSNDPGNTKQAGYSDCSSAVRAAIKAAAGIDIGSNTSSQINNREKGLIVDESDSALYPDESILLPGDCLYFKGNESHPLEVGHVEMYIGDGEICGHGSGIGPRITDLKDYCKERGKNKSRRYFMAIRWIPDYDSGDEDDSPDADEILKRGMKDKGSDTRIADLQQALVDIGTNNGMRFDDDFVDGNYGANTEKTVKKFQRYYGLDVTGKADAETLAKVDELIAGLDADKPTGDLTATKKVTVYAGPTEDYKSLGSIKKGDTIELVDTDWMPIYYDGGIGWIPPKS